MELPESTLEVEHDLHGVLRYARESKDVNINLLPRSEDKTSVWCEFCGTRVKPPLDLVSTQMPEDFCCAPYKELFEKVVQQSRFIQEHSAGSLQGHFTNMQDEQDLRDEQRMREKLRLQEMKKYIKEPEPKQSSVNNSRYTINFKLSACVPMDIRENMREDCRKEQDSECFEEHHADESRPARFGLCEHQVGGSAFILKFYSTGNKFLTAFPDGSAQVLLSMDAWGGQSLDEGGARTRKWTWVDHTHNPTPLRPLYLSLNKHVCVRVLGRECVFVSFLAAGQQARFSVGSCTKSSDGALDYRQPSLCKEELMAQVIQLRVQLALARSRWCLRLRSDSELRRPWIPLHLLSMRKRLLGLSSSVDMEDKDRDFIEHCLQDCL